MLLKPLNDVTTTLEAAPKYAALPPLKGRNADYPPQFKNRHQELYPSLSPLKTALAPEALFAKMQELARRQERWKIVSAGNLRLEAVATTQLVRFKDDVVIEIRPEGKGSSVHMRSRSHLGRNDFGANHKRIKNFLSDLQRSI